MRVEKSPKTALMMSSAAVLSFVVTVAVINLLLPYFLSGDIRTLIADPESLNNPTSIIGVILFVLFLLASLIAIGGYWVYRFFGERYYGPRSLARWAVFGILFAILLQVPVWIWPEGSGVAKTVLQLFSPFAAFFLSRWIIPFHPNSSHKSMG